MIRAIIIDDESNARKSITNLVKIACKNISIIAEADGVESAVLSINKHKPDLIFLDLQMDDGNGFDVLKAFDKIDFQVIFITAFEKFAVEAFKFSAIDYLLKPINPKEFINAVNKAIENKESQDMKVKFDAFFNNIKNQSESRKKLVLKTESSIHLLNIEDIIRCESDKGYTEFHLWNKKKILVSKVIKEFEELLANYNFIRPHQSHLINLNYIESYEKRDGGSVRMSDGSMVPVSMRKKDYILKLFENL